MIFIITITLQFIKFVVTIDYEKPVAAKLWSERCKKNSHVLNDCNWCWCDRTHQYKCDARVCGQVDMFGHFNDAIRDIDVGMEGRGRWRTTDTACDPGVHYRRGSVLCVCNEDGYWPNPVCRDLFRIMHSVEVSRGIEVTQKCEPTKFYVVSCNVCFCPSTGLLNLDFCTKLACSNEDPVLNATNVTEEAKIDVDAELEVYATCNVTKKYSLGCQTCICLRNNRLLCDNCTSVDSKAYDKQRNETFCGKFRIGEIFQKDCNLCFCDENYSTYCTARQCLRNFPLNKLNEASSHGIDETPIQDHECKPGTKYIKDCNICHCQIQNGRKVFSCTLKQCNAKTNIELIENDCVNSTVYEKGCLICRCDGSDVKVETCTADERCTRLPGKEEDNYDLELSYGYCKPLQVYEFDCNTCQCSADGVILKCTTRYCKSQDPVIVDLVPVKPKYPDPCPKGGSYRLECNVCFCLDNGNAICTTNDCEKKYENY